jgi:hypothetical protein
LVLVVGLSSLGGFAQVASAASETTDCAGLQTALDSANTGDTVVLTELCTGQTFTYTGDQSFTLEGQSGSGAGFDGTGAGGRPLSFVSASAPTTLTLQNLVFKNGSQPSTGGAVAFQGPYSVTLANDTFTNNQAPPGPGGAVDVETPSSSSVTLTNDTFTNNQAPAGGAGLGGAVSIFIGAGSGTVTLDGDTFAGNQAGVAGGALELTNGATSGSLSISNSTFQNNTANTDTGGAVDLCECGAPLPVSLSDNTFSGNKVVGGGCGCGLEGGAVFLDNSSGGNAGVTQTGNTFSDNSLTAGTGDVEGGAESASGVTLSSTRDVFTGNSIQAPASGQVSQGAALNLENDCSAPVPQHSVTNTAIAGNSIGTGGSVASAQGALNIHCITGTANPNSLLLRDATISGNTGGGGTAGLWGDANSQATLQNSILNGNSDGGDLGGFSGGSITATYTDLCNGSSPFTGTGNICANPALVNAANGDVHQTSSSPTIDAGSNALVPNGLTTDVYGVNRIQPKIFGGTPVVDMGAAEFPAIRLQPSASIVTPSNGATYALGRAVKASYSCTEGGGGPGISSCAGTVPNGAAIDTSTTGTHKFTVTATSSDGKTGGASVTYTVAAAPSVTIAAPLSGARYIRGNTTVLARYSCHEGASGLGLSSCTGTVPNRKRINTTTPGRHSFRVTARSSDGQVTTATVRYRVVFPSNKPVKPPHLRAHSDGRFVVTVKVPHRGRVDILITAWKDNFAPAGDIGPPKPVLLQPAVGRFVFARAHRAFNRAGTYQILVTPNAAGRRLVMHHRYRVTLRLWISYTPWGGHPGKLGYYGLHLP